jgi:hypothetical protein
LAIAISVKILPICQIIDLILLNLLRWSKNKKTDLQKLVKTEILFKLPEMLLIQLRPTAWPFAKQTDLEIYSNGTVVA